MSKKILASALVGIVIFSAYLLLRPKTRVLYSAHAAPSHYFGNEAISIVGGATRVEVFRLKDKFLGPPAYQALKSKEGLAYVGKPQGKAFASRLSYVLLKPTTYGLQTWACFTPGVAFRLWKNKQSAVALVCFECNNLLIVNDGAKKSNKERYPQGFSSEGRRELVQLVKEAFPDDTVIHSLSVDVPK
jgi:hypothetical protein